MTTISTHLPWRPMRPCHSALLLTPGGTRTQDMMHKAAAEIELLISSTQPTSQTTTSMAHQTTRVQQHQEHQSSSIRALYHHRGRRIPSSSAQHQGLQLQITQYRGPQSTYTPHRGPQSTSTPPQGPQSTNTNAPQHGLRFQRAQALAILTHR